MRSIILFLLLPTSLLAQNWEWSNPLPTGLTNNDVVAFPDGEILIACFAPILVRSTNEGRTWNIELLKINGSFVAEAERIGDDVFTRCSDGHRSNIQLSNDRGRSFKRIASDITDTITIRQLQVTSDSVVLCLLRSKTSTFIAKSADRGLTWNLLKCPDGKDFFRMSFWNQNIGILSAREDRNGTVHLTTDGGLSWVRSGYAPTFDGCSFIPLRWVNDSIVFAYTNQINSRLLIRSTDRGNNWNISLNTTAYGTSDLLRISATRLLFVTSSSRQHMFLSTDEGQTWSLVHEDNFSENLLTNTAFKDSLFGVAIGLYGTIVGTRDGGITWDKMTSGFFGSWNDLLFRDFHTGFVTGKNKTDAEGGVLLRTTNAGATWKNTPLEVHQPLRMIDHDENQMWICGSVDFTKQGSAMIIFSSDGGSSWSSRYSYPASDSSIITGIDLAMSDSSIIWCATNNALLRSSDNGKNWINQKKNFPFSGTYEAQRIHFVSPKIGFVIWEELGRRTGSQTLLCRTTDGGLSWDTLQVHEVLIAADGRTTGSEIADMTALGTDHVWIISSSLTTGKDSLHCSVDAGRTWRIVELPFRISILNRMLRFLDSQHGYYLNYRTSDGGMTWTKFNEFINSFDIGNQRAQFLDLKNGWLIGSRGAILRTTNGGIDWISSSPARTSTFSLSQNFPNPASASSRTTISYTLEASNSRITLAIYDLMGREVQRVIDEEKEQGSHTAHIDASRLPAGVYFYRLFVNGAVTTRKMVVVK